MHRSFLPYVLVILGFAIILQAMTIPLLEWQIRDVVTDFPPNYEIHLSPSPWKARFGDSFNDNLYIYKKVSVLIDGKDCYNEDINLVIDRTQKDEALEHTWLNVYKNISWLLGWSFVEIFLSVLFIWWFTVWHRHSFGKAIALTILAVFIFLNFIPRLANPLLLPRYFPGLIDCYQGTITFNAILTEIHYETPIILLLGILVEFVALLIMLYQVRQSILIEKDLNLKSDLI